MNTYFQVKSNVEPIIESLAIVQNCFSLLDGDERKNFYNDKRSRFNYLKLNNNEETNLEKATLFIFLTKTCFNGIFRVNKQGLFNVPIGAKRPLLYDADNLRIISLLLQNVTLRNEDYKNCLDFADKNTFFYLDPPYRPITKTSRSTLYTETKFNDSEQIRLRNFMDEISERGAKVVISNSDPKNNNKDDNFFDSLYGKYDISRITTKRLISCKSENRGNISELLISN